MNLRSESATLPVPTLGRLQSAGKDALESHFGFKSAVDLFAKGTETPWHDPERRLPRWIEQTARRQGSTLEGGSRGPRGELIEQSGLHRRA